MARDILGEYGRDTSQPQAAKASYGGVLPGQTKDVMNYKPPQGPRNIMDPKSPGLHGRNDGIANRPQGSQSSGSPGIGGTNHGCCGSQGRY
jgi:hypothetical protein